MKSSPGMQGMNQSMKGNFGSGSKKGSKAKKLKQSFPMMLAARRQEAQAGALEKAKRN